MEAQATSTKNISSAVIIRRSVRYEGVAHNYTAVPKRHIIEKAKSVFLTSIFCLIGLLLSVIVYPVFIVSFVLVSVLRIFITLIVKIDYRRKIKVLCGETSFWTAGQNTQVFVQVIQGECDIKSIQQHFTTILSKKSILNQVFFRKYGYFCSSVLGTLDVSEHIKYYSAKSQEFPIKEEEIIFDLENNATEKFKSNSNYDRANWDVLFVPKFVSTNPKANDLAHFALVFRISNTCLNLSDTIAYLCDNIGDPSTQMTSDNPSDANCSCLIFSSGGSFINFVRRTVTVLSAILLGPMFFLRSAMLRISEIPTDPLSTEGAEKGLKEENSYSYFSKSEPFNIEAMNIIKDDTHTSLKAIILSSVGTSIRNLLLGLNYKCPDNLCCAYRSINYCKSVNCKNNAARMTKFQLGIGLDRPIKRLHSALDKTDSENSILLAAEELSNQIILKIVGSFPASAVAFVYKTLHRTNISIEHLIGPPQPFQILGGDVVDIYGWTFEVTKGTASALPELKTFLVSYCGNVTACYTGQSKNISSSHIRTLNFEFKEEIQKIAELCGLKRKILYQ